MRRIVVSVLLMVFVGLCVIGRVSSVFGQDAKKFGYVNLQRVVDEYNKAKDSFKSLQTKEESAKGQRDGMVAEIKKMRDEMELMSDAGKQQQQSKIDEKVKGLQGYDEQKRNELRKEFNDASKSIITDIDKAVQKYGKENNFEIILDSRAIVYGDDALNITEDIIKTLNGKN